MVIGIDASRALRPEKTGVEWYSYHLLTRFMALTTHPLRLYADHSITDTFGALPATTHERIVQWPFPFLWTQGGLSFEMAVRPPDVLFVPSHAIPLVHPRRTITTIHDIGFFEHSHEIGFRTLQYLIWSTNYAVQHARTLITISQFTKNELLRHYRLPSERVKVIPLGYDATRYTPGSSEDTSFVPSVVKDGMKYLLFIGRLERRKNLDLLLRVFERVAGETDLHLIVVGRKGYGADQFLAAIARSSVADRIHVVGWVGEQEKIALLRGAVAFFFPSLYEGFGLPVLEAQGCGTPVVCSRVGALEEVAGSGALYFDPHSEQEAYVALLSVIDPSRSSLLKERGHANVAQYSWDTTARATYEVLLQE